MIEDFLGGGGRCIQAEEDGATGPTTNAKEDRFIVKDTMKNSKDQEDVKRRIIFLDCLISYYNIIQQEVCVKGRDEPEREGGFNHER